MALKKRSTQEHAAPKRSNTKRHIKRFPLLRSPLYNPRLNPPSTEAVRNYFKGKSIKEIAIDRDPLFSPFFLYSDNVVDEIYKLMKTPDELNVSLLKMLFDRIIPPRPRNIAKTLYTTRLSCIVTPEIMSRKYPPWGSNQGGHIKRVYAGWEKSGTLVKGEKGKPISESTVKRIFYDAKKEFKLFEPGLKGSTREEKLDDFLKMLREFADYHSSNEPPVSSLAVQIWRDALKKGKKTALK